MSLKATVCIRKHEISSISIDGLDPQKKGVDATTSQQRGTLLEPSSEKIRIQPTVPPVFLDQILENHGSGGMLRDSFAILRVSYETPA